MYFSAVLEKSYGEDDKDLVISYLVVLVFSGMFRICTRLMILLWGISFSLWASIDELEKDLLECGYHVVAFDLSSSQIEEAVKAYQAYLQLPPKIKSHISFKLNSNKRRSDLGYTLRRSEGTHFDDKEYFHFHPIIFEKEADFLAEQPVAREFMDRAAVIWEHAVETVRTVLNLMEERYPGITARHLDQEQPEVVLRFLQYHPKGESGILAKGHYDAGSLTLAIAESGPGLRIANSRQEMIPVVHHEGSAIFFPGISFPQVTGERYFLPTWHDVVRMNDASQVGSSERWAVVCFFNAADVQSGSWEANHAEELNLADPLPPH